MMMGGDAKKLAMIILGGPSHRPDMDYSDKSEGKEDSDEEYYGVESAMKKFMEALDEKDVKKAVDAMMEFEEMKGGYDYMEKGSDME